MNARMDQRQSLQFTLSKQMLQSVELLHNTTAELEAFVAAEVERNPFLDLAEPAALPSPAAQGRSLISAGASTVSPDDDWAERTAMSLTLHDHLEGQVGLALRDPALRTTCLHVVRAIRPDGYLGDPIELLAMQLGTDAAQVEKALAFVQSIAPAGVGARDLSECLLLQLRDRDRLDPAMQALLANLPLMAKADFPALRRICGVDDQDLRDMFAEIRSLDPKPGRAFDHSPLQIDIPDVIILRKPDGGWSIRMNDAALPKVLINMTYFRELRQDLCDAQSRSYLSERLRAANWLVQALDQRVRTILSVASEIVRQQSDFFEKGIDHLRPLRLKDLAETLGVHESTVSRVTTNKSVSTERGNLPMRFFFPAALSAANGTGTHAACKVRHRIRQIIGAEAAGRPLSDGAIATMLGEQNIQIARRTVTKYREAMNIPSVIDRARLGQQSYVH